MYFTGEVDFAAPEGEAVEGLLVVVSDLVIGVVVDEPMGRQDKDEACTEGHGEDGTAADGFL